MDSDNHLTTSAQTHGARFITGDNLREHIEAAVYQARAERAADLGVLIGTALALVWRALVGTLSPASHSMRALPASRVGRLPRED